MFNLCCKSMLIFEILYVHALCFPLQNDTQFIYDQRQTGKYNIHISIKDVAIIEVDKNEFVDDTINDADEYYYDDNDLTIKPLSAWINLTTTTARTSSSATASTKDSISQSLITEHPGDFGLTPSTRSMRIIPVMNSSSSFSLSSFTSTSTAPAISKHHVIEPVLQNPERMGKRTPPQTSIKDSLKKEKKQSLSQKKSKSYPFNNSRDFVKRGRSTLLKNLFNIWRLLRTANFQ